MLSLFDKLNRRMTSPKLTRGRMAAAMTIAFVADLLQIVLLPVAWTFVQSGIDVVAMLLVMGAIGFHLLLLPTFLIEFMPGVTPAAERYWGTSGSWFASHTESADVPTSRFTTIDSDG